MRRIRNYPLTVGITVIKIRKRPANCLAGRRIGTVGRAGIVADTFGESGPAVELLKKYELDAAGIYKQIKAFL